MASSSKIASTSSSSSSKPRWTHEVFLSFRGEDTRNNFTDHLHADLLRKHIAVFKDDEKLEHGEDISQGLLKAIEESQHAIVVISKNYAYSKWCLAELTKIMECKTQMQMKVWPIFYHVDPSHVRKLQDTFAKAFDKHINDPKVDKQKIETWKAALKEVGQLRGLHVHDRPEAGVVEEISARILEELNRNSSKLSKGLVGMESRVEELKNLLCIGHDDVRCVGIYGISGIGKTTLANLIYDTTSSKFEASCFLAEDEQVWKYGGVDVIANRFFRKKVLIVIDDVDGKKHLKVLEMLEEALAKGNCNWFGPGSRIILTSADRHLISRYVNYDFEVKELNDVEALKLFSLKAFKKLFPENDYLELSLDIIRYTEGLPLAIEVFGSFFYGKSMDAWRSGRKMLEVNLDVGILNNLKMSFDGLGDIQKQLFLDIACFFNGQSFDWLKQILESFGYFPEINIGDLMNKSLIKIKDEKIWMHNMLVQMGRQIVKNGVYRCSRLWHYEDIIDVLKNNTDTNAIEGIRLLLQSGNEEGLNLEAFSKMNRLRVIEIIPEGLNFEDYFLEVTPKDPSPKDIFSWTEKWQWSTNLFNFILRDSLPLEFMPKRFGRCLGKLQWVGNHSKFKLSDKLCLINWFQYPLHSLPATFQSKNLVELRLPCSHVKVLWSGSKSFEKLQVIHLNYSINLKETPDLTKVPNLKKLELSYCTSLSKIHPSIGSLQRLQLLDLSGCKSLKNVPDNMGGMESLEELNISQTSLKQLSFFIGSLKKLKVLKGGGTFSNPISIQLPKSFPSSSSLESLNLRWCNLSDGMIPNDLSSLSSLKRLFLDGNKFKRVSKFVCQLSKLEELGLSHCNLVDGSIPDDISCLSLLIGLDLEGNKFTTIPDNISQLPKLKFLLLSDNSELEALPKLPCALKHLQKLNCPLLNTSYVDKWGSAVGILESNFAVTYYGYDGKSHKILYTSSPYLKEEIFEVDVACGPTSGSEIPGWFSTRSNSSFEIEGCMTGRKIWDLKGLALFIIYEVHESSDYEGSNDCNPFILEIACQMRSKRTGFERRLIEVSPSRQTGFERRQNGVWVFLSRQAIRKCFHSCRPYAYDNVNLTLSVSSNSPHLEVKEYGFRGIDPADVRDWCQVLRDISFHRWTLESYEDFCSLSFQDCSLS